MIIVKSHEGIIFTQNIDISICHNSNSSRKKIPLNQILNGKI